MTGAQITRRAATSLEHISMPPVCAIDRQLLRITKELRDLAHAMEHGDWSLGAESLSDPRD